MSLLFWTKTNEETVWCDATKANIKETFGGYDDFLLCRNLVTKMNTERPLPLSVPRTPTCTSVPTSPSFLPSQTPNQPPRRETARNIFPAAVEIENSNVLPRRESPRLAGTPLPPMSDVGQVESRLNYKQKFVSQFNNACIEREGFYKTDVTRQTYQRQADEALIKVLQVDGYNWLSGPDKLIGNTTIYSDVSRTLDAIKERLMRHTELTDELVGIANDDNNDKGGGRVDEEDADKYEEAVDVSPSYSTDAWLMKRT